MSEQYPLLCEEASEEERLSPRCQRLLSSRARALNHVKGAAVIITRWPGQWTTLLNYWWIGIGMLAITTYILYNCLFSYAMLDINNKTYAKPYYSKEIKHSPPVKQSLPPKVLMHIFVGENQEADLSKYSHYIEIIAKKYRRFNYELIIVNETYFEEEDLSEQESNRIAFNSIYYNPITCKIIKNEINVEVKHTTYSKHFYGSPLETVWKKLPYQFLKFLVRAVSVWDKGGIAFDPIILTPESPNSIYIDKINHILKKYNPMKSKVFIQQYKLNKKNSKSSKTLPNNIQDVIKALENDTVTEKIQESLDGVETKDDPAIVIRNIRSLAHIAMKENVTKSLTFNETQAVNSKHLNQDKTIESSSKLSLLPMFLNYLFNKKETKQPDEMTPNTDHFRHSDADNLPRDIKTTPKNNTALVKKSWGEHKDRSIREPIITSGMSATPENKLKLTNMFNREVDDSFEVTIDLKGNIIATETACHAFLGGIFSNAIHHEYTESMTEFIVKELSKFCRGQVSLCVGIDIILL